MSDKLKPCPFCGGEGRLQTDFRNNRIICNTCGAYGGHTYYSEQEAIEVWNKRVLDTKAVCQRVRENIKPLLKTAKWRLENGEQSGVTSMIREVDLLSLLTDIEEGK